MTTQLSDPVDLLEHYFGYSEFLPGQRRVIDVLLTGHSAAAVFPTGGGKSLCYQLPALAFTDLTLVVSPLIALMKDQIDALRARGIAAARLDSTLSAEEYREIMAALRGGELRLLYVAPERFNNERFRLQLEKLPIALFAVDEAHCISEWGHNFRPDYLKLARFARELDAQRVLALTATATDAVLRDICAELDIASEHAVRTPFYRANLELLATPATEQERDALLLRRLGERPPGATIVYVTLQRTAEELAERLASAGFEARAYHAGMKDEDRTAVQEWFFARESFARGPAIVVATIAFGMGIDKSDIRYVYHYNLPKSLEGYAQEIGRAGRDGERSTCEMLVDLDDLTVLENFVYGDTPSRAAIERFVDEIFPEAPSGEDMLTLALYQLSATTDIRLLVLRTLLTYLELDGLLEGGTPLYSEAQFVPLQSSGEILSQFQGEPRRFLADLFRHVKKGRKWLTVEVDHVASALGAHRSRVLRALDVLQERGLVELRAKGVLHRYRRLRAPDSRAELVESLHERAMRREEREICRLREVVQWTTLDRCQVSALGERFADSPRESCGHCSWCQRGGTAAELPDRATCSIPEPIWQQAVSRRLEHEEVLRDPRSFTRFVCGITSPKLTRAKLGSDPAFGCLREVCFADVLERAREESGSTP